MAHTDREQCDQVLSDSHCSVLPPLRDADLFLADAIERLQAHTYRVFLNCSCPDSFKAYAVEGILLE
jgi:hypothetical protein